MRRPARTSAFTQARRMLRRDWRTGELILIGFATIIAVAANTGVGAFVDRVHKAMSAESASLLGGDMALRSTRTIPARFREQAITMGLDTASFTEMRSVVSHGDRIQLVELKAVDKNYPLAGELMIARTPFAAGEVHRHGPASGQTWVEARLLNLLGLAVGDSLHIGAAKLRISGIIALEPDRGGSVFTLAPRVMIALQDLPATGLVTQASRLTHTLLLAGARTSDYRLWFETRDRTAISLQDVQQARPEMQTAMTRARLFLGIAAWVSLCLSAVAIAMAARRYAGRHLGAAALMRCLGARQSWLIALFSWQLLIVAGIAAVLGIACGYLAQLALSVLLKSFAAASLPAPGPGPMLSGSLTALVAIFGFALPPIVRMRHVPPAVVLNGNASTRTPHHRWLYALSAVCVLALTPWRDLDFKAMAALLLGSTATVVALVLCGLALLAVLTGLKSRVGVAWRYGLANIVRRPATTLLQAVAIGIGIMVLLLLITVHEDMLERWRQSLPVDAPNNFLVNIQSAQLDSVRQWLDARELTQTQLYPMVKARLLRINGKAVDPDDYDNARAQRLASREFNLSSAAKLKDDNRLAAGRWWQENDDPAQFSFETGIAEALGVGIGDELSFDVAGETLTATITNLRQVQWDSFQANFFVVSPPDLLNEKPATWITAFYLPPNRAEDMASFVRTFPGITVLNIEALLARVRNVINNVSRAIAFVFSFTLLAGILVLIAAIQAGQDQRLREAAVLKAVGARLAQIRAAFLSELVLIGILGGTVAGVCASATAWALAQFVFHLSYVPSSSILLAGIGAGALTGILIAIMPMRSIIKTDAKTLLNTT